jgi:hypothetical protein
MRVGDFVVEVVPHGSGRVRELDTGHVLARPGQVYRLRLRNMGPLYCVANVSIDESVVTANGLVLAPWSTTDLERPIHDAEHGRFTVFAEGDETVFGPDGGRDNPALGLIEAKFRRELPRERDRRDVFGPRPSGARPLPDDEPLVSFGRSRFSRSNEAPPSVSAIASMRDFGGASLDAVRTSEDVERAAGTGLTGHSNQRFVPMSLGPLESEATTIRLRLVIGAEEAIAEQPAARPLPDLRQPARPAARP